jgi:DNA-binding HxlR family transcriptional regulator
MYKQFLSIVLSLIMLTGMSASGMAYAQTDDIKKDDSVKIEVNDDTIEKDNEREGSDDDANETEDGIEIEVEIVDGIAKIKIEIKDEESRFKIMWVDKRTTIKEIALRTDLSIEQISNSISFEFEEEDKRVERKDVRDGIEQINPKKLAEKLAKAEEKRIIKLAKVEAKLAKVQERLAEKLTKLEEKLTEKAKLSEERANKIRERIQKETLKTDQRVQKLLDKYQSGEYFGNIKNKDTATRSFTMSFEGTAVEISDSSNVHTLSGELFLENQVTGNHVKKFRVTGGELLVGDVEVYDVVFGKARTSSSGSGGDKDSMIIIAQTSDGVDVKTLKLNIDLSKELNSETDSADIKILFPRSKISSQWFLSGIGNLGLTESTGNTK